MPDSRLRYMPALDGLRAAAVVAVLLYHGDVAWARGGYLGVDAFFVLSGFLGSIAGVDNIRTDGIHFSPQGADVVARWLSPKIVRFANQGRLSIVSANASVGSRGS